MKNLLLLIFLLVAHSFSAQVTFEDTFGTSNSDFGTSGIVTSDGDFLVSAQHDGNGILMKLNNQGDSIWSKQFDWAAGDITIKNVIETQDGGYVLNGYFLGSSNDFLFKTNSNGDSLWFSNITFITNYTFFGLAEDLDGSILLVGYREFYGGPDNLLHITPKLYKFSNQGSLLDIFNLPSPDPGIRLRTIFVDSNNDYVVTGQYIDQGPPYPGMMKRNSNGGPLWSYFCYCPLNGVVNDIVEDDDGGYIGIIEDTFMPSDSSSIIKFSAEGELLWTKKYKPFDESWEGKRIVKSDNGFVIAGDNRRNCTDACQTDIFLFKINQDYEVEWATQHGGDQDDYVSDMTALDDGRLLIVGHTDSIDVDNKGIYILLTDSEGNVVGNEELESRNNHSIYPNPLNQIATISFAENLSNATFRLYNTSGQLLKEEKNIDGNVYEFRQEQLSPGFYLFNIAEEGVSVGSGRLIIQ